MRGPPITKDTVKQDLERAAELRRSTCALWGQVQQGVYRNPRCSWKTSRGTSSGEWSSESWLASMCEMVVRSVCTVCRVMVCLRLLSGYHNSCTSIKCISKYANYHHVCTNTNLALPSSNREVRFCINPVVSGVCASCVEFFHDRHRLRSLEVFISAVLSFHFISNVISMWTSNRRDDHLKALPHLDHLGWPFFLTS